MTDTQIIGITGTKHGATEPQATVLEALIQVLAPDALHHGDCVGVDEAAHYMALRANVGYIYIHPPKNPKYRAFCSWPSVDSSISTVVESLPEREYLQRNREIISNVEMLLAVPHNTEYRERSGTWYTVRYAVLGIGWHLPVWVILPDGTVRDGREFFDG